MKNYKKIYIFLSLFFVILFFGIFFRVNSDSEEEFLGASKLSQAGIIKSQNNPSAYNLKDKISRREMLKVMLNLSNTKIYETCKGLFEDLKADDWGCKYAEIARNNNFITPNPRFRPDDFVSKIEAIKMIFKAQKIIPYSTKDWRILYKQKAIELGFIKELSSFDTKATRGWVFMFGAKVLDFKPDLKVSIEQSGKISDNIIEKTEEKNLYEFKLELPEEFDKNSVEKNIKLYPNLPKKIVWKNDKILTLTIEKADTEINSIIVNIPKNTLKKTGDLTEKIFTKKFKFASKPKVEFVSPAGELADLSQNITVRFSAPIVPFTNLDNQQKCPIKITPNLPGKCVWITTSTFQFRPYGGLPIGAKYDVFIPAGIDTIGGAKTINSKSFSIATPRFKVVAAPNSLEDDQELLIYFNDEISLANFMQNFSITGFENKNLVFKYYTAGNKTNKNIVSIFPANKSWGYSKKYTYNLGKNLLSLRGNIVIGTEKNTALRIKDFLSSYSTFVYNDKTLQNKNAFSNLKKSDNKNIITNYNPNILFNFYKEVSLDKSIFALSSGDFTISYLKKLDCSTGKCELKDDKKSIILNIKAQNLQNLNINLNLSKIGNSDNLTLNFKTKLDNSVLDYKFVDYKNSCVTFKNPLGSTYSYDTRKSIKTYFDYGQNGQVQYISLVPNNKWYKGECKYRDDAFVYELDTKLNPTSEYNLTIKKDLPDQDNYILDKDYSYSFSTGPALAEDKKINLLDNKKIILVPENISPLGVAVETVNLDRIKVEVCEGDFAIEKTELIKNSACTNREVSIKNTGFKSNFSVIDLESVFGKTFSKKLISFSISKLDKDKATWEKTNQSDIRQLFLKTNKSIVLKAGEKESYIWLNDYSTGDILSDKIEKIEAYNHKTSYSVFGKYEGQKNIYSKNINFEALSDGIYKLESFSADMILVTLKSKEQIFLDNSRYYNSYYSSKTYTYLNIDRSLYKPGDKVYIKGISRKLAYKGYDLNTGKLSFYIRGPQYKQLVNNPVTLSDKGDFDYIYEIPDDAKLGQYTINSGNNSINFYIEQYEKPDFKIESKPEKKEYIYGETAKINISADYYIGLPLQNSSGKYNIQAEPYYFDGGKTKGYIWGNKTYSYWGFNYRENSYKETLEYSKKFDLKNGKTLLSIPLINKSQNEAKDKIFDIISTVTDENTKKSISSKTSFKVLTTKKYVGMKLDKYYYEYADNAKLDFATVDFDGNILGNKDVKFNVYTLNYEKNPETLAYEEIEKNIYSFDFKTDDNGQANIVYGLKNTGKIKLEIEFADGSYKTSKTIFISGQNLVKPLEKSHDMPILSSQNEYRVGDNAEFIFQSPYSGVKALVTVEKLGKIMDYKIVDILSKSQKFNLNIDKTYLPNFDLKVFLLKNIKNSENSIKELKALREKMLKLELDIKDKDYPVLIKPYVIYDILGYNFYNTKDNILKNKGDKLEQLAQMRKKEQSLLQNILPDYLTGKIKVKISTDTIKLNTKISLDKDYYNPGDSQIITLNVLDNAGKPISGTGVISIVDKSLFALKDSKKPIIDFFYSEKNSSISTIFNIKNLIKRLDFSNISNLDQSKGGNIGARNSSFGNESIMMDSFAEAKEGGAQKMEKSILPQSSDKNGNNSSVKIRENFKDLAFYKTNINIIDGKATIKVPKLPDDLTTWALRGIVFTDDTKLGDIETSFITKQDLLIIPSIPRFFVAGDKTNIKIIAVNNTNKTLSGTLNLNLSNTEIKNPIQKLTLKPNSQTPVSFEVTVKDLNNSSSWNIGTSDISIILKSGDLGDYIKTKRTIIPYATPEYVFTNGSTEDKSYAEKIVLADYVDQNKASLDISLGATILTNLTDSINSLATMPQNNFYYNLSSLYRGAVLKKLYGSIGQTEDFKQIKVIDYNGNGHFLDDIINLRIKDFEKYQQTDGGFAYYEDCFTSYYQKTCSNFNLTKQFLQTYKALEKAGYSLDSNILKKALSFYKKELEIKILKSREFGGMYKNISDFIPLAKYGEKTFIKKYLREKYSDLKNIEKLNLIYILQLIGDDSQRITKLINEIKNTIIIEARGSLVPSDNNYFVNNIHSTALALDVFINNKTQEKLILENMTRWLIYQKDESGIFHSSFETARVIEALTNYILYTGELENVDFEAKGFLNSKEITTAKFDKKSRFNLVKNNIALKDNIKFGDNSENILGFEKVGSGKLYYDVGMRYYLPIDKIQPRDEGMIISRKYYNYDEYIKNNKQECVTPYFDYYFTKSNNSTNSYCRQIIKPNIPEIKTGKIGEYLVGEIKIVIPHERKNIEVNNFIPAGAEIVNSKFDTTSDEIKKITGTNTYWGGFDHIETKTDRVYLHASYLRAGTYKYTYVLKLNHTGIYHNRPAVVQEIEKPEIWGRTGGGYFEIKD